jgi:phosphatidyl-myo-inositol alpha-mannosyltransferase
VTSDVGPARDPTSAAQRGAGLRVAIVCPYDLSRPGGVQGQAVGLAQALRRLGHEVVVVAPDDRPHGWSTGHVYVAGRSVGVHSNGSVAPVSVSPLAARRALDAVRAWGADVVHLHEPFAPVLGYGFLISHGWPTVGTFHRSGVPRAATLASPALRWACGRVDVATAVSEVARRTAAALCGGRIEEFEVLFNGVDMDRFALAQPVASDAPAVLFLGRHERRKGLGVLLEAFCALVSATSPNPLRAELWVAGEGPETEALKARYPESPSVHWLGLVSDTEAADRAAGAAVLCAPSLGGESFGMVLLEGMAARCRVVASDIPGYREAAGGHAMLVPPGDAGALRAAIAAALSAPGDPSGLDAAAAHAARWSMERLATLYVDSYLAATRLGAGRERRAHGHPKVQRQNVAK